MTPTDQSTQEGSEEMSGAIVRTVLGFETETLTGREGTIW
jgi:hypothetical protein